MTPASMNYATAHSRYTDSTTIRSCSLPILSLPLATPRRVQNAQFWLTLWVPWPKCIIAIGECSGENGGPISLREERGQYG